MRAPNISLFPRVYRTRMRAPHFIKGEGSKHFIVFKGYRRTCMRAPNISLFPRVIGGPV